MIKAKKIFFNYEKTPVLEEISLELKKGQVLTLLGPNGSGKTTLLKCLNASLKPKRGSIYVDGKDSLSLKPKKLAQLIATLFQSHVAAFPYRVRDLILMGRAPYLEGFFSTPTLEDRRVVEDILTELEISHFADRPYTQLSGGERQLVLLARALAQQPRVLVLDEPTAPLDFKNTVLVLGKVKELARKKELAVIMTLHDPNYALLFSDLIAFIKKGKVLAWGTPGEVVNSDNMKKVYGVEVDVLENKGVPFIVPKI